MKKQGFEQIIYLVVSFEFWCVLRVTKMMIFHMKFVLATELGELRDFYVNLPI